MNSCGHIESIVSLHGSVWRNTTLSSETGMSEWLALGEGQIHQG